MPPAFPVVAFDPVPLSDYTADGMFGAVVEKDPVNLLYAGQYADLAVVRDLTVQALGLVHDKIVSDQVFGEPAPTVVRHRQDLNQAEHFVSVPFGRYHTRVFAPFLPHPVLGRLIASPIHRDRPSACGDCAESFDEARDWAVARLPGEAISLRLPRVLPILQCDGSWTPNDGYAVVVAQAGFFATLGIQPVPTHQ